MLLIEERLYNKQPFLSLIYLIYSSRPSSVMISRASAVSLLVRLAKRISASIFLHNKNCSVLNFNFFHWESSEMWLSEYNFMYRIIYTLLWHLPIYKPRFLISIKTSNLNYNKIKCLCGR